MLLVGQLVGLGNLSGQGGGDRGSSSQGSGSGVVELCAAVIGGQVTGNGDGVALGGSAADDGDIVAQQRVGTIGNGELVGTLSIGGCVRIIDDGAGDGGSIGQMLLVGQLVCCSDLLSQGCGNLAVIRRIGRIGSFRLTAALAGDMLGDPAVLDLRGAVILTDNTVNGDGVTGDRLDGHSVIALRAVGTVGAVNGQLVAGIVGEVHVAVLGIVDLGDNTGDIVLTLGIGVVSLGLTQSNNISNAQLGVGCGIIGDDLDGEGGGDIADLGQAQGIVIIIGAQIVLFAVYLNGVSLNAGVIGKVGIGSGIQLDINALGGGNRIDVDLGVTVHDVEQNTVVGFIYEEDGGICLIFSGGQVVLAVFLRNTAVEVQLLAQIILVDIHQILGAFVQRTVAEALPDIHDLAALIELDLAFLGCGVVVVLDGADNGNHIANFQGFCTGTAEAVADNGLIFTLVNSNGDADVSVLIAEGSVDGHDLTGQNGGVGQRLALGQGVSGVHDALLVVGHLGAGLLGYGAQLAAGIELDGTGIVLDLTGDGDDIVDIQSIGFLALQAVAQDLVAGGTVHIHHNGNVLVLGAVCGVDTGDNTGQSGFVRQGHARLQIVSGLHDLQRIGGSLNDNAVALNDSHQLAAGIKFNGTVVVLQIAVNGDGVANHQILGTVALQAVALDGLVFPVLDDDGNGDVLVLIAPCAVHGDDLAHQGIHAIHGGALIQGVSLIDDILHAFKVHTGQDIVPAGGLGVAVAIGAGSSQNIGSILCTFFVHIDGDSAVVIDNDLQQIFTDIGGPDHFVGDTGDTDNAEALEVTGSVGTVIPIDRIQISDNIRRVILAGNAFSGNFGDLGGLSGISCLTTAGQQAQHHGSKQDPGNNLFHSKLLQNIFMMNFLG